MDATAPNITIPNNRVSIGETAAATAKMTGTTSPVKTTKKLAIKLAVIRRSDDEGALRAMAIPHSVHYSSP